MFGIVIQFFEFHTRRKVILALIFCEQRLNALPRAPGGDLPPPMDNRNSPSRYARHYVVGQIFFAGDDRHLIFGAFTLIDPEDNRNQLIHIVGSDSRRHLRFVEPVTFK